MVLPIAMLRSLHMGKTQKFGLVLVFALVLAIVTMDILRTVYTLEMDLSEGQDTNALWGILEPTIAVMICALPCYRGLLRFNKCTTQNESFWSIDRVSAWSRLLRASRSVSETTTSNDSEEIASRDLFKKDSYSHPSHV
jgi:hypothetical protein